MSPEAVVKFFLMVFGKTCLSHMNFMDRLTRRLQLREVCSEEEDSIIIAFVAVESRVGTDINAALQRIPQMSRPVVLVVLHHTFDPYFVAPNSRHSVDRSDVFTVDCLFHEDQGLLRCERNDLALREVTDHLISKGVPAAPPQEQLRCRNCNRRTQLMVTGVVIGLCVVVIVIIVSLTVQKP